MNIEQITARQILDSRGNPTVEAEVWCNGGHGRASVPSGASTGKYEAHELRDHGSEFSGQGVSLALENINGVIKDALMGVLADDQHRIDELMIKLDGTQNKERLGANAILAVSLACAHAAANVRNLPLYQHINDIAGNPDMSVPMPMFNVLNGGRHATQSSDFQEFMIVPVNAHSYHEAVKMTAEIFMALKQILHEQNFPTTVGDEGGFAPSVKSNMEMFELLIDATKSSGYEAGVDVMFAIDVAASEFFVNGCYRLKTENRALDKEKMLTYLKDISEKYPVVSIEDGLGEDEWEAWSTLTRRLDDVQVVGDDLLVTNQERLEKGIKEKSANAILIKPNQIGTLTETVRTIARAKASNWNTIISHRSGETEDVTIAHLAVGSGAGQIKTGSITRGERTAKHNEIMRIEESNSNLTFTNPFE